jgi:hypothetical protein
MAGRPEKTTIGGRPVGYCVLQMRILLWLCGELYLYADALTKDIQIAFHDVKLFAQKLSLQFCELGEILRERVYTTCQEAILQLFFLNAHTVNMRLADTVGTFKDFLG